MDATALLSLLRVRFEAHMSRHPDLSWMHVQQRLMARPDKLPALAAMESTGGEPDVIGYDTATGELHFVDCSRESPSGRRSLCYDRQALDARKANQPAGCVQEQAAQIGIDLLDEAQYRHLQTLGEFDLKTSSWIQTPPAIRQLGGALFAERRYGSLFVFHNGAQSYYAARGFRGMLRI